MTKHYVDGEEVADVDGGDVGRGKFIEGNGTRLGVFRSPEGKLDELDKRIRAPCLVSGVAGGNMPVEPLGGGREAEALLFANTKDPSP